MRVLLGQAPENSLASWPLNKHNLYQGIFFLNAGRYGRMFGQPRLKDSLGAEIIPAINLKVIFHGGGLALV